ncbi:uncharacterized protein B0T15DRAFT_283482 [Chaetomium strumarium]|uniref:LysM domain-containing protein n=1 Tax=Chaetomium strumarium TaxID=1170767 RepID=A0AAJ0GPH8_9PEZI|nr:hypothetical protein B0T15DRAFT_283482 [Chaetomium strumarium]
MLTSVPISLLVSAAVFNVALGAAVGRVVARDGSKPSLSFDPNTTGWCTWWADLNEPTACSTLLPDNNITLEQFRRWNPSVPETCGTLPAGHSYCVEAFYEPVPSSTSTITTTTARITSSTTTPPPTTTTLPGNGVTTPAPIQAGMVGNCNKFHFVEKDQNCATIAALYSISTGQFSQWNPAVKSDCSGLWASTYACVGVLGGSPAPSTTLPANGIATPSPTHPGMMVSNCNKFTKVNPGDSCDGIAFFNGPISTEDFVLWNTGVGGRECRTLQADTYVCVGLIPGGTPTQPGNGIATPAPAHPGMVGNCNKFYKVNAGDSCDSIAFWNGVPGTEWVIRWNAGVGSDCRTLQANTYACIGVIGGTPTQPGNGIATPTPILPGMVDYCKKFTKVNPGDTCDIISFFNGPISTADFIKWNPGVGGQECRGLQAGTYVCIGV